MFNEPTPRPSSPEKPFLASAPPALIGSPRDGLTERRQRTSSRVSHEEGGHVAFTHHVPATTSEAPTQPTPEKRRHRISAMFGKKMAPQPIFEPTPVKNDEMRRIEAERREAEISEGEYLYDGS